MTSPRSRAAPLWLAFSFVVAVGAGAGYLAADPTAPARPAATVEAGYDHGAADRDHADTATDGRGADEHGAAVHTTDGHGGTAEERRDATQGHGPARAVAAATGAGRSVTLAAFGLANVAIVLSALVVRRRVAAPAARDAPLRDRRHHLPSRDFEEPRS